MFTNLKERFGGLTLREKIIVIVTLCVILWSTWDEFFFQPTSEQRIGLQRQFDQIDEQLQIQQRTLSQLENHTYIDPNQVNRQRLVDLTNEYDQLREQMMLGNKKFVPAKTMTQLLNDLLNQNKSIRVTKFDTLKPLPLIASTDNHPIFKHGLEINFKADYRTTLDFLNTLENLPWALVWESIDYQVFNYPIAEIKINIYTLSFEENWLDL